MALEQSSFQRYGRFYRNARKYASRKEVLISSYIILSLFTVSFFAAVFIRPTAVKIALLWREIQDKRSVYSKLEKKIRDLEKAQELLTSIDDQLVYLETALPQYTGMQRFMQTIEYIASANGLDVSSGKYPPITLYPETASASSTLTSYPFEVSLLGSTSQLLSFIEDIEKLDRFVRITKIKIAPEEKKEINQRFTLTLSVSSETYSYPLPGDI